MSPCPGDIGALSESANHRAQAEADFVSRLQHIRRLDPDLPYAEIARRLRCSTERVRKASKALGLPAPRQGLGP